MWISDYELDQMSIGDIDALARRIAQIQFRRLGNIEARGARQRARQRASELVHAEIEAVCNVDDRAANALHKIAAAVNSQVQTEDLGTLPAIDVAEILVDVLVETLRAWMPAGAVRESAAMEASAGSERLAWAAAQWSQRGEATTQDATAMEPAAGKMPAVRITAVEPSAREAAAMRAWTLEQPAWDDDDDGVQQQVLNPLEAILFPGNIPISNLADLYHDARAILTGDK